VTFLLLWTAVAFVRSRGRRDANGLPEPGGTAVLALVGSLVWLVYVARQTTGYLMPHVTLGVGELLRLMAGEERGRQLFRDSAGQVAPMWERMTAFTSVGFIVSGLPFGLLQIWRRHRDQVVVLALGAAALAYPLSLPFRLTRIAAEASNRTAEFLFVAVAFVLAVGVTGLWLPSRANWRRRAAFTGWAAVLFAGGVIVGWPHWARLPGPYLVGADLRSIEPQGVAAAEWALRALGPGNRVAADRTNRLLMMTYGRQRIVTNSADLVVAPVFFAPQLGPAERELLQLGQVRYLVVDHRLSRGLPLAQVYYEDGEPGGGRHRVPISPAALAKFDGMAGVSRLMDSGDIVVYDVAGVSGAP
jgi:hypothetical protein